MAEHHDTLDEMAKVKPWPLYGYAPGGYMCRCLSCSKEFTGDKRALHCLECAASKANEALAARPAPARGEGKPTQGEVWSLVCKVLPGAVIFADNDEHLKDLRARALKLLTEFMAAQPPPAQDAGAAGLPTREEIAGVIAENPDPGLAADALATLSSSEEVLRARVEEQADEINELRLAICGGEDAPGYASSLSLRDILEVQRQNAESARRDGQLAWDGETADTWKARAQRAETLLAQAVEALGPYIAQGEHMSELVISCADIPAGIVLPQPWHLQAAKRVVSEALRRSQGLRKEDVGIPTLANRVEGDTPAQHADGKGTS